MRVDLHRHLGGSINYKMVHNVLKAQGHEYSLDEVRRSMTYEDDEPRTFYGFLDKFRLLREIIWDKDTICEVISSICWGIIREQLDYVEIKLSIDRYLEHTGLCPESVAELLYDAFDDGLGRWGINFGLVLSLKYESDRVFQSDIARKVSERSFADCFVGIDLVGDEARFDVGFYEPIFGIWKDAGKGLEAHVGESQSAENVRLAIERLGVNRIAHGVSACIYPDILKLAKRNNVCFDIAPSSNWYTGVVPRDIVHPARMIVDHGCRVTIGTDDPEILCTTLDDEYRNIASSCSFDDSRIIDIMTNSVICAFKDFSDVLK